MPPKDEITLSLDSKFRARTSLDAKDDCKLKLEVGPNYHLAGGGEAWQESPSMQLVLLNVKSTSREPKVRRQFKARQKKKLKMPCSSQSQNAKKLDGVQVSDVAGTY